MDFFARQEAARRTTRWLLLGFLVSVALVVVAVDVVVATLIVMNDPGASPVGAVIATSLVLLAIIGGASFFKTMSLRSGGGGVARSLGGSRVDRNTHDPALKRLHNVVEEMAIAAGVTMPEVYVLEQEDGINAFAAGNSPADAAVAVTRGAVTQLKRDELQGVIAHEFSHILNGDMRLNLRLLGWVFGLLAVAIVGRLVLHGSPHARARGRRDGAGALMLAALAVMLLGYVGVFFGRLLQAAVSRHRERLADASAVQFTRDPAGLAGALLKIAGTSAGSRLAAPQTEEVAHMLFAPGLSRLFATHPPIAERLRELEPGFRDEDLPARARAAAAEAAGQRARVAGEAAGPAAKTSASGAGRAVPARPAQAAQLAAVADGSAIAAQTGNFGDEHVRYAERARADIPAPLREFVESADHARALVLVLLLSDSPEVAASQRRILAEVYGEEHTASVIAMRPLAVSLPPALRLPAVQQLFPALRRSSHAERQVLRDVVARLALADARIEVFECCLTLLLAASLREELEAGPQHGSASLFHEVDAVHTLFAILAAQGAADPAAARQAYEAGIAVVLPQHRPAYRDVPDWPRALGDALARLVGLRPFAKKVLIEGLVRCIAHDRTLSVAEGELLRTVCALLHCPLPPIVAAGAAT